MGESVATRVEEGFGSDGSTGKEESLKSEFAEPCHEVCLYKIPVFCVQSEISNQQSKNGTQIANSSLASYSRVERPIISELHATRTSD